MRYLAFLVSRFTRADRRPSHSTSAPVATARPPVMPRRPARRSRRVDVASTSGSWNPGQQDRGPRAGRARGRHRPVLPVARRRFAVSRASRSRWSRATLPGGHSPATSRCSTSRCRTRRSCWRNDPASFEGFPDFFLAHELAHQWWGQAVGWRNYHEQWLSEGFAQYFAALYAQHSRGRGVRDLLRQMRQVEPRRVRPGSGLPRLPARPHPGATSRVFRALVYNKGAAVLHMLRRFVGDEAFFAGSAGSTSGRGSGRSAPRTCGWRWKRNPAGSLERFFERWIYGASLPRLTFSYRSNCAGGRRWCCASSRLATLRPAGHGHAAVRRPQVGRRRRSRHRTDGRHARPARRPAPQHRDQPGRRNARGGRKPLDRHDAAGGTVTRNRRPSILRLCVLLRDRRSGFDMIASYGNRHADDRRARGHRREGQDRAAGRHRERHPGAVLLLPPRPRHRRLLPRLHREDREDAQAADLVLDRVHRRHGRQTRGPTMSWRRARACSSSC